MFNHPVAANSAITLGREIGNHRRGVVGPDR